MDRCSALTVEGHEDFSTIRSLGNPEKALVNLCMTTMTDARLETALEDALDHGITEDEMQDVINFAWTNGFRDRAAQLSKLVTQYRGLALPTTSIIKLSDHETLVWDTNPNGTGVPIVCLHALTMDASMWRAIYPGFAINGTRVIMYDIRGFGHASNAPLTTSMTHLSSDLKDLLDNINITKADIYGISYGGGVAQTFAIEHPEYTRSVAILASTPTGTPMLLERATMAENHGMEALVAPTLTRWLTPESIARNAWYIRYARTCVRRCKVENWATAWHVMATLDVSDRLSEIKVPVLAVAGGQDPSTPPTLLKMIAQKTGGRYVEVEGGMHMINMEQAEVVLEILKTFRGQVDGLAV